MNEMEHIPVAGPWITDREVKYVTDAARNAWYTNADMYHKRFAEAFTRYLNVRFAVPLPSCTSAIHLSLMALNIGPGDEVILPDITWIASSAPISYVGATPVFADIDPDTWCLSAESLEKNISEKTKALIAVDLYGNVPDWDKIRELADTYGIAVIEDAAEALGSEYKGRKAGSFGDTGVFSFHGSKTVTTGEGGMLTTNNKDLYDRVLLLLDHGRAPGEKMFWNLEVAHKYKMSSMQAALGLAQMERIEELIHRKRMIFGWYQELLAGTKDVILNSEAPATKNSFWMVTAILNQDLGIEKEQVIRLMRQKGIDCRPFFYPLSSLPAYQDSDTAKKAGKTNWVSYGISPFGVNLPSGMNMTLEKTGHVCEALQEVLARRS